MVRGGGGVTSTSVEKLHSGVVSVGGGFVGSEKKIKRNILITHENVHICCRIHRGKELFGHNLLWDGWQAIPSHDPLAHSC